MKKTAACVHNNCDDDDGDGDGGGGGDLLSNAEVVTVFTFYTDPQ